MIIIGDELIDFEYFNEIHTMAEISRFDNLLFKFDREFIKLSKALGKNFSVRTNNKTEILLANAAGAKFIIVSPKIAKQTQEMAEYYLFDAKIAVTTHFVRNIKKLAELKIDAVILNSAIISQSGTFSGLTSKFSKFSLPKFGKKG